MIKRNVWKSRQGEPFTVAELTVIRLVPAVLSMLGVTLYSHNPVVGMAVVICVYLVADRMVIIGEWVYEIKRARRADARMLAALNRAAHSGHMAVRM